MPFECVLVQERLERAARLAQRAYAVVAAKVCIVEVVERSQICEHFAGMVVHDERARLSHVVRCERRNDVLRLRLDEALQRQVDTRAHARAVRVRAGGKFEKQLLRRRDARIVRAHVNILARRNRGLGGVDRAVRDHAR